MSKINEVYILLDMTCGMRCRVCPYWGDNGVCYDKDFRKKYDRKLSISDLIRFVDEVKMYNPSTLTLSGGEPLEFDGWQIIAKHAKNQGLKVALSTNAIHMSEHMNDILRYVDNVQISLPGTKDLWEETRQSSNNYDVVVKNIKLLSSARKSRRPFIRVIYVLSGKSYSKAGEFYNNLKTIGIDDFFFQHVMYIDDASLQKQKILFSKFGFETPITDGFKIDPGRINIGLMHEILDDLNKNPDVTISPALTKEELYLYYDPESRGQLNPEMKCKALYSQVDLYPNGDILVCPDYILGNIRNESFEAIWNGQNAKRLRRFIEKEGRFPACQSCFYYYVSNEGI